MKKFLGKIRPPRRFRDFGIILLLAAFLYLIWVVKLKTSPIDFDYLVFGCDIFDKNGKIIEQNIPADVCDFSSAGQLFVGSEQKVKGVQGNEVFSSNVWSHHDQKFSLDEKSVIQIEAVTADFKGQLTKMDCAARRRLTGEIEARWCLSENLHEFADFLPTVKPWNITGYTKDQLRNLKTRVEISHANSIYEIPSGPLQNKDSKFSGGNYLFNLHGAMNALIILDHDMKSVLRIFRKERFPLPADLFSSKKLSNSPSIIYRRMVTHDDQITSDGMILSYATVAMGPAFDYFSNQLILKRPVCELDNKKMSENRFEAPRALRTVVIKWNPLQPYGSVQVIWTSDWRSNEVSNRGWVSELKNGNFLISHFDGDRPEVFVVGSGQKVLWRFAIPDPVKKIPIRSKPLYKTDYLRRKGLL